MPRRGSAASPPRSAPRAAAPPPPAPPAAAAPKPAPAPAPAAAAPAPAPAAAPPAPVAAAPSALAPAAPQQPSMMAQVRWILWSTANKSLFINVLNLSLIAWFSLGHWFRWRPPREAWQWAPLWVMWPAAPSPACSVAAPPPQLPPRPQLLPPQHRPPPPRRSQARALTRSGSSSAAARTSTTSACVRDSPRLWRSAKPGTCSDNFSEGCRRMEKKQEAPHYCSEM